MTEDNIESLIEEIKQNIETYNNGQKELEKTIEKYKNEINQLNTKLDELEKRRNEIYGKNVKQNAESTG